MTSDPVEAPPRAEFEISWLRRRARRLLGSNTRRALDSQDLVQHAQLEAARAGTRLQFADRCALRAWLARVVGNAVRRAGRREALIRTDEADDSQLVGGARTPSAHVAAREQSARMLEHLTALPERARRVVELRMWDGLEHEEIAVRLGISAGNSRVLFHRALATLRERISDADPVDS